MDASRHGRLSPTLVKTNGNLLRATVTYIRFLGKENSPHKVKSLTITGHQTAIDEICPRPRILLDVKEVFKNINNEL